MLCITSSQAMVRNKDKYQRVIGALIKKERRKRHRLKELGIDYDFPGYVSDIGHVLQYTIRALQFLNGTF